MTDEPHYMIVTTPFLFCNFVERQTRSQRSWLARLKSGLERLFNREGRHSR
ncbi:MAG TPA: hypothetical protein VHC39_02535 [Rhizomicrobium sp.]|nr:hypothetical protein [Rhizomicrobium sp.]